MWHLFRSGILAGAVSIACGASAHAGEVLEAVQQRGYLNCGVSELTGRQIFSNIGIDGEWEGFDVDFCRAIATAVVKDRDRVKFTQLSARNRFEALQSGNIDVLIRGTTWTYKRDTGLGVSFAGVTFYDAQGFLTESNSGISSLEEGAARGAKVCVIDRTTTLGNLRDYIKMNGSGLEPLILESGLAMWEAFANDRCELVTTDLSSLISNMSAFSSQSGEFRILDEVISKEPLGPSVREGDLRWFDVVRWVVFATIAAEELGITSENVDELLGSRDPEIRRMLGVDPGIGEPLGLDDRWLYRVVRQVGNYGEIYERMRRSITTGVFDRGLNRLWTEGGLMYAMPFR